MTIWFLGDSWPGGAELGRFLKDAHPWSPKPRMAFPGIIAEQGTHVENFAVVGSSVQHMIDQYAQCDVKPNDIVIIGLTAKARRLWRNVDGTTGEEQFMFDSRMVNSSEDDRVCSQTAALLYYMVKEKQATPYFYNIFDLPLYKEKVWDEIPDENWLLPRETSIINLFDSEWVDSRPKDEHFLHIWLKSKRKTVEEYIYPCETHPNIKGHELIAQTFISKLHQKGHSI